jgi:ABC-type antimicrobial peptide transport system permease subunit
MVITLQEQVDRSTSPQMVAVTLVGVLGGLALLLAAIGLYGVMSYAVSQSTRELGLRMALGAGASNLLRLVLSRGLALTAGGVALGAAVALGLTRLLGNLLFVEGKIPVERVHLARQRRRHRLRAQRGSDIQARPA